MEPAPQALSGPNPALAAIPQLSENSRRGFGTSSGTLRWASGFAISRSTLGFKGSLYDDDAGSRSTGKERDSESGNDYFGARYYASTMGRFLSPDEPFVDQSAADPQSWNLYSYVRNNPLANVDPDGQDCIYLNGDGTGSLKSGDCFSDTDSGIYVNGTVDPNSFQYNAANNSSSFSYTPYDSSPGTIGLGTIQGPDLNGGFDPGSLGAAVFGAQNASTWNNAAGAVNLLGGIEASIMAPGAVALAQCSGGQSRGACAVNLAISVLPEVSALRAGKTLLRAARGVHAAEMLESAGGVAQMAKDFEALGGTEKTLGTVKVRELSDGTKAVMRNFSRDGRPTLELQYPDGTKTEIRYNP